MDSINSEELEVNARATSRTYISDVSKLSTKLTFDVSRSLFEKSYRNSRDISLGILSTSCSSAPLPDVCPRCYTHQSAGALHSQLLPCHRSARSVRYITAKKRSVLHKLSSREKMMIDSHDQWSNILLSRCRACGLKTRQLCPLPGQRPAPSNRQREQKQPEVVKRTLATMMRETPSKKKKQKKRDSECGLLISEDLKKEIQMTMAVVDSNSSNKKKKRDSPLVVDSKANVNARVLNCEHTTNGSKIIELDSDRPHNNDSTLRNGPHSAAKSDLRDSTKFEKNDFSKVLGDDAVKCNPIIPLRANDSPKSKPASKLDQRSRKQGPESLASNKLQSKVSPAVKKMKVCEMTPPPSLNTVKKDISIVDHDNSAQYGVPLLRINEVKKPGNVNRIKAQSNALRSALKKTQPPPRSKSIKSFLNTLF